VHAIQSGVHSAQYANAIAPYAGWSVQLGQAGSSGKMPFRAATRNLSIAQPAQLTIRYALKTTLLQ